MNRLFLILPMTLILCFMVGCQDKAAMAELEKFRAQAKVEEQNKEIVRRLHDEVWSKGNLAVADELYAADYVAHWISGADTRGLEAFKEFLIEARGVFSDYTENIEQIVAEGDLVVTRFSDQGTFKGKIIGIPSNNKKVTVQEIAIFRIVNRKVVEQWTIRDSLGLYQQLGMELKPKEGAK
jgi:predicted ester cyclase